MGEARKVFSPTLRKQLTALGISKIWPPIPAAHQPVRNPRSGLKEEELLDLHSFERPGGPRPGAGFTVDTTQCG